jgi:hypothetical protein
MFAPLRPKLAGWQALPSCARVFDAMLLASRGKVIFEMGAAGSEESQRSVSGEWSVCPIVGEPVVVPWEI